MSRRDILARVRRLSIARVARHGPLPADPGVWWQQIETLAVELAVPITWDEWLSVSRSKAMADDKLAL